VTTIVVVDDHPIVRRGLRSLLEGEVELEIVAEAGDLQTAHRELERHRPDLLILDLHMPGGSSLPSIARLLETSPRTRILVLTMHEDLGYARRALDAGAMGYMLKESTGAELVQGIRTVAAGEMYVHPRLGGRLAVEPADVPRRPAELSRREAEVLRLIALGHTTPEIAQRLFLSVRTIEGHRAQIQRKLGLANRVDLVRYALEHRLIDAT
jgi:two-component system response regulator NreC